MYFPANMTFQYFFFDTYPGYFLQVLPLVIIVGLICLILQCKKSKATDGRITGDAVLTALFAAYLTGLIALTVFLDLIQDTWYLLLYHQNVYDFGNFFALDFNLVPDFWHHFNGESIGNVIMFFPFGILYPAVRRNTGFQHILKSGISCVVAIELLQLICGRAFDINDVILNTIGVFFGSSVFFLARKILKMKQRIHEGGPDE